GHNRPRPNKAVRTAPGTPGPLAGVAGCPEVGASPPCIHLRATPRTQRVRIRVSNLRERRATSLKALPAGDTGDTGDTGKTTNPRTRPPPSAGPPFGVPPPP